MYKRILSTILTISILFNMVGCERKKFFDTKKDPHELEELIGYEDISKWILEINKIAPEFEYKDYYFNEKDLKEIYRKSLTTKECENKGKNSYKELYKEIIKNNSKFGESPFSHINSKDSNESEIYANYSLALYKALQNIFEGKEDMYEDYCKLKDVVILIGAIEGNTVANTAGISNITPIGEIRDNNNVATPAMNATNVVPFEQVKASGGIPPVDHSYDAMAQQQLQQKGPVLVRKKSAAFVKYPVFLLAVLAIGSFGIFIGKMFYTYLSQR